MEEGPAALTPGKHTVVFDFKYEFRRSRCLASGYYEWIVVLDPAVLAEAPVDGYLDGAGERQKNDRDRQSTTTQPVRACF